MPPSGEPRHRRNIRHGLSSRTIEEDRSPELEVLADALRSGAPAEPHVLEAARDAAEAILHHHRVKTMRTALLNEMMCPAPQPQSVSAAALRSMMAAMNGSTRAARSVISRHGSVLGLESAPQRPSPPADEEEALGHLLTIYRERPVALKRLAEYERKALSRRTSLLRQLDFEMVEAERRRVAKDTAGS